MLIFLDVDNTILEHSGFYSLDTEKRIHSTIGKFPKDNKQAIKLMYSSSICRNPDIIRKLFSLENVYILTKYPAYEYEEYKQEKIANILGIKRQELINLKDKNNINKYICLKQNISKVDMVKDLFDLEDLNNCILVDDYSTNIIEWEHNKGIGIKYYNEYNSPNHPLKGISISNFKIFSHFFSNTKTQNLFISCDDSYILYNYVNQLKNQYDYNYIDIMKEVYHDFLDKIQKDRITINTKYNYFNILKEYYLLQTYIDDNYWANIISKKLDDNRLDILCASFDLDFTKLKNIDNESLVIKIIEKTSVTKNNIYDIYITLDHQVFLSDVESDYDRIIKILNYLLFGDNI